MGMNPDLAKAIPEMVGSGVLEETKARKLLRMARGELISIHPEIRLLFYFGVLITAAGVGLLVKQNYQQIGPLAISIGVGIGALAHVPVRIACGADIIRASVVVIGGADDSVRPDTAGFSWVVTTGPE